MSAYYITTIIGTQEVSMSHITSTSGSLAQAPVSSVAIRTTITARAAAKKSSKTSSTPVQNHSQTGYIIYIMENKNSQNKHSLIK